MKGNRKRLLLTLTVGALLSLGVLLSRGTFTQLDGQTVIKDLSDAFFVAGALIFSMGALVFVAENGVFDMLSFGVKKVVALVRSEAYRAEQPKTYYDYVERQQAKPRTAYGYLLKAGLAFLAAAILFVILHETA